jgi:1-deoxy-D-xylulose-5-phosphate synthase
VDRAGLVPGDGETHQGIYDPAFFSQIGIPTVSPANYAELKYCLAKLLEAPHGPAALRYPRGGEAARLAALGCTGNPFDCLVSRPGSKVALVSYGSEAEDMLDACDLLEQAGIACDGYKLLQIYPLPEGLCEALAAYPTILFAEECVSRGGIGEHLLFALQQAGWKGRYLHCAIDNTKLTHATVPQLKHLLGLDAPALAQAIKENLS